MAVVASCPGKVLCAGGYVVLERPNAGLVVATSARFYAVTSAWDSASAFSVQVCSPQFQHATWTYQMLHRGGCWAPQPTQGQPNPFVQSAVVTVIAYLSAAALLNQRSAKVVILGDNDFYTQSSASPPPFAPLGCTLKDVHKTGLGSSAAMTTSLVGSLLSFYSAREVGQGTLHNLAQFAHAYAQGKVGSGFDVSSAVYGTHQYQRFDPSCLAGLLDRKLEEVPATDLMHILSPEMNFSWTEPQTGAQILPLTLPPLTVLLLADVDAGSNTPSMVSKVQSWRKSHPEHAQQIWKALIEHNHRLAALFLQLQSSWHADAQAYAEAVQSWKLAQGTSAVAELLNQVAACMQSIRQLMKSMGQASQVGIEPDEQTALLDACCALDGVVGAGVPGAGGLDAVFVLAVSAPDQPEKVTRDVEAVWSAWDKTKVTALSAESRAYGAGIKSGQAQLSTGVWMGGLEDAPLKVKQKLESFPIAS